MKKFKLLFPWAATNASDCDRGTPWNIGEEDYDQDDDDDVD